MGGLWPAKDTSLFDGTAHFAHADDFAHVIEATPEFVFWTGATGGEQGDNSDGTKEGN